MASIGDLTVRLEVIGPTAEDLAGLRHAAGLFTEAAWAKTAIALIAENERLRSLATRPALEKLRSEVGELLREPMRWGAVKLLAEWANRMLEALAVANDKIEGLTAQQVAFDSAAQAERDELLARELRKVYGGHEVALVLMEGRILRLVLSDWTRHPTEHDRIDLGEGTLVEGLRSARRYTINGFEITDEGKIK